MPIVFAQSIDPVAAALSKLWRARRKRYRISQVEYGTGAKWLELLKQVAPQVTRGGAFANPDIREGPANGPSSNPSRRAGMELSPVDIRATSRRSADGICALPKRRCDRGVERDRGNDSSRPDHIVGCPAPLANCISLPLLRHRRWPGLLWARSDRASTDVRLDTSIAFSGARSPPTCRCRLRPSTNWSINLKTAKALGLDRARQHCSPAPTR